MSLPYLTDDKIETKIEEFLNNYKSKDALPVDVEHILEFHLGASLNIVPNLKKVHGIECFLSADFSMITIDDYSFQKNYKRSRFTIAHEIGHIVLHKNYYESLNFSNPEEYIDVMSSIPDSDHKKLEIQASIFAGYLLMPTKSLKTEIKSFTESFGGTEKMTVSDLEIFVSHLSEKFLVSNQVIEKQLKATSKEWLEKVIGQNI